MLAPSFDHDAAKLPNASPSLLVDMHVVTRQHEQIRREIGCAVTPYPAGAVEDMPEDILDRFDRDDLRERLDVFRSAELPCYQAGGAYQKSAHLLGGCWTPWPLVCVKRVRSRALRQVFIEFILKTDRKTAQRQRLDVGAWELSEGE